MNYSFLNSYLMAVAQKSMDKKACKLLSQYVAFTRALYSLHQQNHWDAQRYGDHLLFERLYGDAQGMADAAAERVIGLCGELLLTGSETDIVKKYEPRKKDLKNITESSLAIEEAFQVIAKETYDAIQKRKMLTLGLDDMIMAQASLGEEHLYLLKQVLKGL